MKSPTDRPHLSKDPFAAAEAVFAKKRTAETKSQALPNARELVSLRLDSAILEHFQAAGPGWQDRINDSLRAVVDAETKA